MKRSPPRERFGNIDKDPAEIMFIAYPEHITVTILQRGRGDHEIYLEGTGRVTSYDIPRNQVENLINFLNAYLSGNP